MNSEERIDQELYSIYKDFFSLYERIISVVVKLDTFFRSCTNEERLVNDCHLLKNLAEMADEARKKFKTLEGKYESYICLLLLSSNKEKVVTDYCSAVVKMRTLVNLPTYKKNYNRYCQFMEWLGIPKELYESKDGEPPVIYFHWVGAMNYIADKMAKGEPSPPGVDPEKTTAEFSLSFYKRKGVVEQEYDQSLDFDSEQH
jgi:hypothetical protein